MFCCERLVAATGPVVATVLGDLREQAEPGIRGRVLDGLQRERFGDVGKRPRVQEALRCES